MVGWKGVVLHPCTTHKDVCVCALISYKCCDHYRSACYGDQLNCCSVLKQELFLFLFMARLAM